MTKNEIADKLYYDSDCPICSAEMKKLSKLKKDSLILQPINTADVSEQQRDALYHVLHVQTVDGKMIHGYAANIYAWQQTRYRYIATAFAYPPLSWLGKIAYALWIKYYHFKRRQRLSG